MYTPDLLFADDPDRDTATLRYVKDLGLNMMRLEGKFPGERPGNGRRMGIPLMSGWMCCNQWEKWAQWDAEDDRVAQDSLSSQILMLRLTRRLSCGPTAATADPRPPSSDYHGILSELHWQNAVVDTVSSVTRDASGENVWDGIQMAGPYSWRPPSTGSPDGTAPREAPRPSRATTNTSRPWRA